MARFVVGVVALALVGLACGSGRPPAEGSGATAGPSAGAGGGNAFDTDAGTAPPGCGSAPDGTQCECLDAPLFVDAPTIYFVLDRSRSMAENDKWNQVRITVAKIMRGLGPRANFGATMFPGTAGDDNCAPGTEVMAVRPGDAPSSGVDGPTTKFLLAATRVSPTGGTPTSSTLEYVRTRLVSSSTKSFVILATDGAPNCNENAGCGFDECQYNIEDVDGCPRLGPTNCCAPPLGIETNCSDGRATVSAIGGLANSGVPTYVLGLPGTDAYASLLDDMAVAGGTAQPTTPKYFAVSSANQAVILAQLKKIAAQIAGSCTFDLKEEPNDPNLVNVYMDDVVLPYEPVNGWSITGKTVTLLGGACDRVKAGDVLSVRIIRGCPRVGPG